MIIIMMAKFAKNAIGRSKAAVIRFCITKENHLLFEKMFMNLLKDCKNLCRSKVNKVDPLNPHMRPPPRSTNEVQKHPFRWLSSY